MLGEFKGEYTHSVDGKGRVAIPARFRAKLDGGAVLTRGIEPCLLVYTAEMWEQKSAALEASALTPAQRRRVERQMYSQAQDVELDAQGRVLLPLKLRQFAGIEGDAVIVGARDRFEIWGAERWADYLVELDAEDLSELPLPF
jgi:transcriptional regulator MraZ